MPFAVALLLALQGDSEIAKHVDRLSADDLETRERAAAALRSIGDDSIPALESAAATGDAQLRIEVRRLLRDLSATSALVEDLRSDDIPGNARTARARLRERYGPKVRAALVEVLKSDDDQKAVQAAFILITKGDQRALLAEAPEILVRAARAIAQEKAAGFRWVAAEVAVSLGASLDAGARDRAWAKALVEVDPSTLKDCVLDIHQVSARAKAPLPGALVRHYLRNLMNDNVYDNASQCRWVLRRIGPEVLVPELRAALSGYDAQARSMIVDLLLTWNQEDLPVESLVEAMGWSYGAHEMVKTLGMKALPSLLRALKSHDSEVVLKSAKLVAELKPEVHDAEVAAALAPILTTWWSARDLLLTLGPDAESALRRRLEESDSILAMTAARGLLVINPEKHADAILARAERELAADSHRDNARRASQVIFELGGAANSRLQEWLHAKRGQPLVCAAAVLARRGRLGEFPLETLDAIAAQAQAHDEPGALVELLHWSEPVRVDVLNRLEGRHPSKAGALRTRLLTYRDEPWLTGR